VDHLHRVQACLPQTGVLTARGKLRAARCKGRPRDSSLQESPCSCPTPGLPSPSTPAVQKRRAQVSGVTSGGGSCPAAVELAAHSTPTHIPLLRKYNCTAADKSRPAPPLLPPTASPSLQSACVPARPSVQLWLPTPSLPVRRPAGILDCQQYCDAAFSPPRCPLLPPPAPCASSTSAWSPPCCRVLVKH
jgi:hypothetical protein